MYDTEGNILERNVDYVVRFVNNVNVGKATGIIQGIGYCAGTETVTFTITPVNMGDIGVDAIPVQKYTGEKVCPELNVKWGDKILVKDVDYKVSYVNNVKPGKATVTIKGIGNFLGSKQMSFTIKHYKTNPKLTLNKQKITLKVKESIVLKPTLTGIKGGVKWNSDNKKVAKVSSSGKVTAISSGTASITAVSKKNKKVKAVCKVTVIEKEKVTYKNSIEKSTNNMQWGNVVITNYSDMKKFINQYKSRNISIDNRILNKLKTYDASYFKKNGLCINTVLLTSGVDIKIDSIFTKQINKKKFEITVNLKTVDYRDNTMDMVNHICFINIPIEKAKNSKVSFIIK